MTLEEYRKKQAEARKTEEKKIRAAGEGVDDSQWKNVVPIKKKDEDIDVCCGHFVALCWVSVRQADVCFGASVAH